MAPTLALGVTVVACVAAEVALFAALGFTPLYPLVGGIGAATVFLSLLPSVRVLPKWQLPSSRLPATPLAKLSAGRRSPVLEAGEASTERRL